MVQRHMSMMKPCECPPPAHCSLLYHFWQRVYLVSVSALHMYILYCCTLSASTISASPAQLLCTHLCSHHARDMSRPSLHTLLPRPAHVSSCLTPHTHPLTACTHRNSPAPAFIWLDDVYCMGNETRLEDWCVDTLDNTMLCAVASGKLQLGWKR